ncbi:MAG: hypothetical protein ACJAVR_001562 [Paracoccaceae bacterium]|jgi:hypothetical protein
MSFTGFLAAAAALSLSAFAANAASFTQDFSTPIYLGPNPVSANLTGTGLSKPHMVNRWRPPFPVAGHRRIKGGRQRLHLGVCDKLYHLRLRIKFGHRIVDVGLTRQLKHA